MSTKDIYQKLSIIKKGAKLGNPDCYFKLAYAYQTKQGISKNLEKTIK